MISLGPEDDTMGAGVWLLAGGGGASKVCLCWGGGGGVMGRGIKGTLALGCLTGVLIELL